MGKIEEIKKVCKNILEEGKVKYIIGYQERANHWMAKPAFITNPDQIDRLVWDPTCVFNLVRYLRDEKSHKKSEKEPDERPVGIIVKGCDSRAINVLLQEKFIKREEVYIIGVACENLGVVDEKKLEKNGGISTIKRVDFGKQNDFLITTEQGTTSIPAIDIFENRCVECLYNTPVVYDVLIGEKVDRPVPEPYKSIENLESYTSEEKWEFWKNEMDKCIRCYACRSVCPMCYCDECVADSIQLAVKPDTSAEEKAEKIRWVEKSPVLSENFNYHLLRALHLTGRCVDCEECDRVCPVDIPLRHLNKKMEKEATEQYEYTVGIDPGIPALVTCFKEDDPEGFIL